MKTRFLLVMFLFLLVVSPALAEDGWYGLTRPVDTLDAPVSRYQPGVAVQVLSTVDGVATVSIIGGETVVRIPADALAVSEVPFDPLKPWTFPGVSLPQWTHRRDDRLCTFFRAPGSSETAFTLAYGEETEVRFLGWREDGWLHALHPDGTEGFIRRERLPDSAAYAQAVLLKPDYTFFAGSSSYWVCAFVMWRPDGELVFVGCEDIGDGVWKIQESQPLPEGLWVDDYHLNTGDGLAISFPHPSGELIDGETAWTELAFYIQPDGSWQVQTIFDPYGDEYFHFEENGLYINDIGKIYGSIAIDRDICRVNVLDLPLRLSEALTLMQEDWGMVIESSAPLCENADGSIWRTYFAGTPVKILALDGDWAKVSIAGGAETGWMPRKCIGFGAAQMYQYHDDLYNADFPANQADRAPRLEITESTPLYAEQNGPAAGLVLPGRFSVMSQLGEGWYHLREFDTERGFYVQTEAQMAW